MNLKERILNKLNRVQNDNSTMQKLIIPAILLLVIVPVAVYGQDNNLTFEQFFNINHFHQGDVLTLTNTDSVSHKLRIYNSTNPLINSLGVIAPNETLQMLLPSEGDYYFYDELNPSYHGEMITHQANIDLSQFTNEHNTVSFGYSNLTNVTFGDSNSTQAPADNSTLTTNTSTTLTPDTPTNSTTNSTQTETSTVTTITNKTTTSPNSPPVTTTVTNTVTTTKVTSTDHVWLFSQNILIKCDTIRQVLGLPPLETIMQIQIIQK